MIDQNILLGGGVALLGTIGGVALVAFTEAAGERTNERGALSGEQQSKFAGKFLEDIEADQSSEIGDVLSKMEAALGDEVPADTKPEAEAEEKKQTSSDGW